MKLDDIIKLMEAAQANDFDVVELEEDDFYIKLERNCPVQQVLTPVHMNAAAPIQAAPVAPAIAPAAAIEAAPAEAATDEPQKTPGSKDITSPLVGIFHELPGDKAVKIGSKLKKGDTVCMVEAMKLMNEIHMPEDGEIVWAALEEGSTVEYEQLLFSYVK